MDTIGKTNPMDEKKFGKRWLELMDRSQNRQPDLYQMYADKNDRASHEAMKEMLNRVNPKQQPPKERASVIDTTDTVIFSSAAEWFL